MWKGEGGQEGRGKGTGIRRKSDYEDFTRIVLIAVSSTKKRINDQYLQIMTAVVQSRTHNYVSACVFEMAPGVSLMIASI